MLMPNTRTAFNRWPLLAVCVCRMCAHSGWYLPLSMRCAHHTQQNIRASRVIDVTDSNSHAYIQNTRRAYSIRLAVANTGIANTGSTGIAFITQQKTFSVDYLLVKNVDIFTLYPFFFFYIGSSGPRQQCPSSGFSSSCAMPSVRFHLERLDDTLIYTSVTIYCYISWFEYH